MSVSIAAALITLVKIVDLVSIVFAVFYLVYSGRYYGEKVSAGLYFLAVLMPLVAVLIQLSRTRHFQGAGLNVCRQCGEKVPPSYEVCPRCLVPLTPYDEAKKQKDKKLSRVMLTVFSVGKAISVVCVVVVAVTFLSAVFSSIPDREDTMQRVSFTVDGQEVYYDKKGISYENAEDVVLYAQDGTKYVYNDETECYIGDNGDEFDMIYCYVDGDGWFYYDADDSLTYVMPDDDYFTDYDDEALLDWDFRDLFSEMFSFSGYEVWSDELGNVYYWADTASWNEEGGLITAQYETMS